MKEYNLLEETYAAIDIAGVSEYDILWCGSPDLNITWENYKRIAKYTDFKNKSELPIDLVIVANGWYMQIIDDNTDPELFEVLEIPFKQENISEIKHLSTKTSKYKEEYPSLIDLI